MTGSGDALITAFEKLPPAEREAVLAELLRRLVHEDHENLSDEDLTSAADEVLVALDREESTSP